MGKEEETDGALVRRVLAGDAEAFAGLVERYRTELGRFATGLVGDADAAEDALQEAFISAYRNLAKCREPDRFKPWMYRIVANRCHDARRGHRAAVPIDEVEVAAKERADRPAEDEELADRLERAMEALTPEQREAFVMKEVEGKSYEEMVVLLDTKIDALRMRVHRARTVLRQQLGEAT